MRTEVVALALVDHAGGRAPRRDRRCTAASSVSAQFTEAALSRCGAAGVGDDDGRSTSGATPTNVNAGLPGTGDRAVAGGDAGDVGAVEPVARDLEVNDGARRQTDQERLSAALICDVRYSTPYLSPAGFDCASRNESLVPDGEDPGRHVGSSERLMGEVDPGIDDADHDAIPSRGPNSCGRRRREISGSAGRGFRVHRSPLRCAARRRKRPPVGRRPAAAQDLSDATSPPP